jgi:hypothetical protein
MDVRSLEIGTPKREHEIERTKHPAREPLVAPTPVELPDPSYTPEPVKVPEKVPA